MTIANCRREQIAAAEAYLTTGDEGALLGMGDWVAEEFILEVEANPPPTSLTTPPPL